MIDKSGARKHLRGRFLNLFQPSERFKGNERIERKEGGHKTYAQNYAHGGHVFKAYKV